MTTPEDLQRLSDELDRMAPTVTVHEVLDAASRKERSKPKIMDGNSLTEVGGDVDSTLAARRDSRRDRGMWLAAVATVVALLAGVAVVARQGRDTSQTASEQTSGDDIDTERGEEIGDDGAGEGQTLPDEKPDDDQTDDVRPEPGDGLGDVEVQATLVLLQPEDCRNSGWVEIGGVLWNLAEPAPVAWQGLGEQNGQLSPIDDDNALFVADDGTRLSLVAGAVETECIAWEEE